MIRFAPMIRLDIRHDYHGDVPPPLTLEPDPATARLAARPDLRLRVADGMAELFASEDRAALTHLAAEGALTLTFRLRPRVASLATVTATLAETRGQVVVIDGGPEARRALHAGSTIGDAELRPLVAGEIVTPADVTRPPLAIIRLALDPHARDVAVSARFGAVAQIWTYHVIGGAPDAAYGVRDRTQTMTFEPLGPRTMSNGARALSFRSSAPIPARARPAGRFELVSEGPFGARVVVPVLPAARPDPGAVAEILVNLW